MSPEKILLWLAFAYLLTRAARYLLGARAYLVCALRAPGVELVGREQLDPCELQLMSLLDEQLTAAGFRHVGFLNASSPLTYHNEPLPLSVFVNERLPAYAFVRPRSGPEYGNLVELEIETAFASGLRMQTRNSLITRPFMTRNSRIEAYEGMPVADQVERHKARLAGERSHNAPLQLTGMDGAVKSMIERHANLRAHFREEGWIVPTSDPDLDRFTLVGSFALAHYSRQLFGARKLTPPREGQPSEEERKLRVEADLRSMLRVAERPQPPPGTPWPLITVIALTAASSFAAMALLWNTYVAGVILAVVTLHESGHALAMRLFGYRDVHVFFVPLLGAVTVGQPATTTVRDRLAVLLAGPLPGLWLGVLLLALDQTYHQFTLLRVPALALLIVNGLNLLPFTPLDGGRVLESLLQPESVWRPVIHGVSVAGLIAVAIALREPAFVAIGVVWAVLLPQQIGRYTLRRSIAAHLTDRTDFQAVVRAALQTITSGAHYAKFRSATRQATARVLARAFTESLATAADRRWGVIAYASALIPLVVGIRLWFH